MASTDNLLTVARALLRIRETRFVFAGASVLPLLIDDPGAPPPRSTVDVNAVVDVLAYHGWEQLRTRLEACNLRVRADASSGKGRMCLFHLDGIEVDIMPVKIPALGCPSRMLEVAFDFAEPREVEGTTILIVAAPGMVAAKLEAFAERGQREFPASDDLEDIVALFDGRRAIEDEVMNADYETRLYISRGIRRLLDDRGVRDVVIDIVRDGAREKRIVELMTRVSTL